MIHIDQLLLRIPGITPEEGRIMAESIAAKLSAYEYSGRADRNISQLNIRVTINEGTGRDEMAAMISGQILSGVKEAQNQSEK